MAIRSHGSVFPTDPLSAILLSMFFNSCSAEGPTLHVTLAFRPFPHALCRCASALPATFEPCFCSPSQPVSPSAPQCHPAHLCHPLARPAFLPPRFHHLLLFEPSVGSGALVRPLAHYSPPSCPFPATLHCLHHIKSISGPDRVGPPFLMCYSHVLFWSEAPSWRKYKFT